MQNMLSLLGISPFRRFLRFLDSSKDVEIRFAVAHGVERVALSTSKRGRILDRLGLRDLREDEMMQFVKGLGVEGIDKIDVDVGIDFSRKHLSLPAYLGDIHFDALSKYPNIILAEVADRANVAADVGERGLHPDVGKHENIVVQ